ncbi:MAG: sensor histidine kinase, partial [Alteromonadales bacterium]|nr:sensor histidine kinase [Alteromonadales bacterium]
MLFDSRNELSRSSILKWLVLFAIVLFFIMGLLTYQLYHRSVELYNDNLDRWLISESEKLTQISEQDGLLALQENIQQLNKDNRYIYHFNTADKQPENNRNYPIIAQVGPSHQVQNYPTMRATKVILADGRELVVGINIEQYQQFKNELDLSIVWGVFYSFLG